MCVEPRAIKVCPALLPDKIHWSGPVGGPTEGIVFEPVAWETRGENGGRTSRRTEECILWMTDRCGGARQGVAARDAASGPREAPCGERHAIMQESMRRRGVEWCSAEVRGVECQV